MSEETANKVAAPTVPETEPMPTAPRKRPRDMFWWGILGVYMILFLATGYIAFLMKDRNPALDPSNDQTVARLTDDNTRTFMLNTLAQEAEDHKKKTELGAQSFNVVLGALLGFLSASAVSRATTSRKDES
jgi:hypothetical protein